MGAAVTKASVKDDASKSGLSASLPLRAITVATPAVTSARKLCASGGSFTGSTTTPHVPLAYDRSPVTPSTAKKVKLAAGA